MKQKIVLVLLILFTFTSCFEEDTYENTKQGNFEALWKMIDERYCFFEYKDIDWNEVHDRYSKQVDERMTNRVFFDLLKDMLAELKDGHVNLSSSFDQARYWKWYEDYPYNFNREIQRNYIGTDYHIAAGIKYKMLANNIGYIHYASFSNGIGSGNLSDALWALSPSDGLILDVRDNGGGFLSNSEKLASHFMNEKTLVGYIQHKTGKGHNDFSKPYATYVERADGVRYQKTVVVLTNRRCFSSTNDFVNAMTYAPNAIILGDKTGGGSGLPFTSELPNGWGVRFSASPMLNAKMEQLEFGIDPDFHFDMKKEDMDNGKDTMMEEAIKIIKSK